MTKYLVLTCEHAGNEIPEAYTPYFAGAEDVLKTHRGFDPGAYDLFKELSKMAVFSQEYMVSRLLVEPNRFLGHRQLFSEFTSQLKGFQKEQILEEFYTPYRNYIESKIRTFISEEKTVLHVSVHSFTPIWSGEIRNADIGLLFDPGRQPEAAFCQEFRERLLQQDEHLNVRFNYPYLGVDDGFTSYLRERFPKQYMGIELEVNQKYVQNNMMKKRLKNVIFEALLRVVQ